MPPPTKIAVALTAADREALARFARTGERPAAVATRARILLKADAAGPDPWPDEKIADPLDVSRMTVQRVRQQFAREGLDATLHRKRPTGRQYRKLDRRRAGGQARRHRLLGAAGRPRPLDDATFGRPARRAGGGRVDRPGDGLPHAPKNDLKPWLEVQWVLPPQASGAFVANMEDVVEVYHRPADPARPVVCGGEAGKQHPGPGDAGGRGGGVAGRAERGRGQGDWQFTTAAMPHTVE